MSSPATVEQVRALADELVRSGARAGKAVAISAAPMWSGPDRFSSKTGVPIQIAVASTVLAFHDALADHTTSVVEDPTLLLVLTDRDAHELDLDIMSRLARPNLVPLERWSLLRARLRLGTNGLDRSFGEVPWLADALIQHEPAEGWPALATGFLDRVAAWSMLRRSWLGLDSEPLRLEHVAAWCADVENVGTLSSASPLVRDGATAMLATEVGDPAGVLLRLALAGRSDEIIPLGLVCDVLFADGAAGETITAARVRLEYEIERQRPTAAAAQAWGSAAVAVVRSRLEVDGSGAVAQWLSKAERLLAKLDASSEAHRSSVLSTGFEQRLALAAQALTAGDPVALGHAADLAGTHALAAPDRMAALTAAVRVLRRQVAAAEAAGATNGPAFAPPALNLEAAARTYAADGAFVDAARLALRQGDSAPELAAAYTSLLATLDTQREAENRRFAELLAAWSSVESGVGGPFVTVEQILDDVVAPISAKQAVLLVVLDGASRSSVVELSAELERNGWQALRHAGGPERLALAGLPTTTEVSRASLFCGRRVTGTADLEKKGFADHDGLRRSSPRGAAAPVLFHKGELSTSTGDTLASPVRTAIGNPACRVVGVVVNAIDDHLNRGQQINVRWGLDTLVPLKALMAEAAAAGRVVVLTSDHGHVLDERRHHLRPYADASERWRPATDPPGEGEVLLAGPRVQQGGRIVVPWTETLHYGGNKHGYHGGITPQEVLIPLLVLSRLDVVPDGWEPTRIPVPTWWRSEPALRPPSSPASPGAEIPVARKRPKPAPSQQPDLFGSEAPVDIVPVPGSSIPDWVSGLFASEQWHTQRQLGRATLDDAKVAELLDLIDRRGGVVHVDVLAADAGVSLLRLPGVLSTLRRLLNVDGYQVLDIDGQTIRLDRRLLAAQFGVGQ